MAHCADGGARIYHKRGSIPAGLNSHGMCLRGSNVDVFPVKEQFYILFFKLYEEHLQGLTFSRRGFSLFIYIFFWHVQLIITPLG